MHRFTICLVLTGFAAAAAAQTPLGFMNNTDTSFTSRGSATVPNTNPSISFLRIDKEAYAGWGVDPANPGMRQILGIRGMIQDQIGNTPETYDLYVYTEDPTNPNYPDVTAPVATISSIPTPPSTATTPVAFAISVNFTTPALAPATGDVFLGIGMPQPAVGTWPTDGLSCHALYFVSVTSGTNDLPGASHPTTPPENGNGGWYVPTSTLGPTYTTTPRQWKLEPLVAGAAGTAGTITNQSTAPQSNNPPGTSSMASGLFPDAQNPPLNLGRVDDIASRWYMDGAPDGSTVFFLASFAPFWTEVPASVFLPGATGAVCIDQTAMAVIGLGSTLGGEAYLVWNIPIAARSSIAGIGVVHQSLGIDAVTGSVHVNGCTRQVL